MTGIKNAQLKKKKKQARVLFARDCTQCQQTHL